MPRRSYDQYCAIARALDTVGDRWTLLIVRELLAGPRRYTDLHADLPGVSTDMLASRLRDMERDELVTRRRLAPPGVAYVYDLTPQGRELLPVLSALAGWGGPALGERRPTDAVRAHWFAIPLMRRLRPLAAEHTGAVEVRLPEGIFHLLLGEGRIAYRDGALEYADARLALDAATCRELADGELTTEDAVLAGRLGVTGDTPLADAVRGTQVGVATMS
ncbi:winged helix-turn-helix transcriptional regulator [Streptomyces hainanensis]|uniref:Transcriptional regulator n=1 Tax=Streptomyces hainanensis TaxID=402648 RepID=A0A4R4TPY7_9ACTN|nr:helix-turn-helix domain-containing protein [Streptomyces hainanensis]TDC77193.1 transcriptional regulator [Streptomyces hainanensis]